MPVTRSSAAGVCWILLTGCVFAAHSVTFEVKDGNSTCIKADLNASFSITYTTTNGTSAVRFALPSSAVVGESSSCGEEELQVSFGAGHSLTLLFSKDEGLYRVSNISLQYNLSDSSTFPQSSSTGLVTVMTNVTEIWARLNSTYRCVSSSSIRLSSEANLTFSDVHLEAYMRGADFSSDESVCSADQTVTTSAPTQSPRTTAAPSPVPPPAPERGNYTLTDRNGTACLLALMGLQLNITHRSRALNQTVTEIVNLQPNRTAASGSCGVTVATLVLTEDLTNLTFTFTLNSTTQKYFLSSVSVSALWPDMTERFVERNASLNLLQCSVGRSYMCSSEQTLSIVSSFSINTFRLQLQPFNVTAGRFSAVEECRVDQENMLIPIIVGVALAGLVLIVLIAYLIGRKRTHAGYQTI
ncbi:lysosome-associated membrane glycoprotein 1a [Puntigrus tetrazona]|uniref:lysosome-associated membrane glycoprotein 1a n=1 Tax=Puntigrus tetrazona TaxID=1606681 RepID=UPI001C8A623C|nr:lysosome-associated membrane glycoprotein 1a [Puntigrus tetrazona]XP_043101930.1 lysosome-associated membrane glycoprotein 1a [Puntigrus tetrazona]XP_043101940.1 lysosome-associated membrane glycoprotein 1a [Puntigrus tetrazona]